MSYKVIKNIEMSLTPSSIARAIGEIGRLQHRMEETVTELVRLLMEEGIEIAKMQVVSMSSLEPGEHLAGLEEGISGYFIPDWGVGFIYAESPYAIFVEYGTGIVGEGHPHPGLDDPDWHTPVITGDNGNVYDSYDSQGHGRRGWVYMGADREWHWTRGAGARPFMYNTLTWLEEIAPERMAGLLNQM